MPQRPYIPPAGTPLSPSPGAHREILEGIARTASRQDWLPAGIAADDGTIQPPPPVVSLALFQLTGNFSNSALPDGETWPFQPKASWFHAPATRLEYYPAAQTWNTPAGEGDESTVAETAEIWHQAGYQLDSVDPDRTLPAALAGDNAFMPAAGNGQWVWCFYDDGPGCWVMLQPFEDILRVKLTEDLYPCASAAAQILIANGDASDAITFTTTATITVYDPLAAANADILATTDANGDWFIPSGTYAYVKRFVDDNAWEPLRFMPGCQSTGSGGSEDPNATDAECPPGYAPMFVDITVNGKMCKFKVCCPVGSGSGGGYATFSSGNYVTVGPPGFMPTGADPVPWNLTFTFEVANTVTDNVGLFTWGGSGGAGQLGICLANAAQVTAWMATGTGGQIAINVSGTGVIVLSSGGLNDGLPHTVVINYDGTADGLTATVDGTPQTFSVGGVGGDWRGGLNLNNDQAVYIGYDALDDFAGAGPMANVVMGDNSTTISSFTLFNQVDDQTDGNNGTWVGTQEYGPL